MKPVLFALALLATLPLYAESIVKNGAMPAAEANQAAIADARFVYAIDSTVIAKYDRITGQKLATSTGDAKHLNSGAWWGERIICAHSNFPRKPEQSQVRLLDPDTMQITILKDLGAGHGSLTWVVREGENWWCTFAHYGADQAKTSLVKYDPGWGELAAWTYPPDVIARMGKMSISGGLWRDGVILATGHDALEIYRLRLPKEGSVLELIDILKSPFPGQGIALDRKTGGLVGINRTKRTVVFADLRP
jgi:hypothetical protein